MQPEIPEYADRGPFKVPSSLALDNLIDKSVLITGGASGLGKAYAEAFCKAGSYVTIVDFDAKGGEETAGKLAGKAQFVKCDVRNWDEQVQAFEAAVANSPQRSCDVVIANAGIVGVDDVYTFDDPAGPPKKPNLRILEINLLGLTYTAKLAMHYFRKQPLEASRDRCLILKASIAAYEDQPGSPQYNMAKFGVRGLMRNLRRTAWKENIRVNLTAPWYIRTPILSQDIQDFLDGKGVGFAEVEDATKSMLMIASDTTINGRAFGIVSRVHDPQGVLDLDLDDYKQGSLYNEWQDIILETAHRIVE